MVQSEDFVSACTLRGYSFFSGVPCSLLKSLIDYIIQCPDMDYLTASSEGEAVGIAAGAYLAGCKTVVMCQNSGLGNMVNPLTSLNFPFRIPTLLVVTLRGEPGLKDEPQHELMGQITGDLLDTLRIPWAFLPGTRQELELALEKADKKMAKSGLPFAFVVKKGTIAESNSDFECHEVLYTDSAQPQGRFELLSSERMPRMDAIEIIRAELADKDVVVATTGKIGRELFTIADGDNQLYVVGSMGCASAIAFGIQHILPSQWVIVLDGDGAALMKMGTIATIGHYQPAKFIHIILDNEAYESTGGQFAVSDSVDFCDVASACKYRQCYRVDTKDGLKNAVISARKLCGPTLIHVKVACGSARDLGRPDVKPFRVKERLMRFLSEVDLRC